MSFSVVTGSNSSVFRDAEAMQAKRAKILSPFSNPASVARRQRNQPTCPARHARTAARLSLGPAAVGVGYRALRPGEPLRQGFLSEGTRLIRCSYDLATELDRVLPYVADLHKDRRAALVGLGGAFCDD